ncbi:hypothetical protein AK88_04986 [Plasmodium fragile]|uniref:Schizont-infected cell agglutination C-terminal domain-containing protein n=1 Tax=Plasmodium fragile TaxID=5857 RepID=A0A0D9QI40_PLAFR|nr:uncharacterized protein AK88_04986 [Plasmodium fragile]KJP85386.1 hypothetical protein AK88_04986 [Plasmodium fragile]
MVDKFLTYMEKDNATFAQSCDDQGWGPYKIKNWHNADDTVVCKMMVPALFFMNGWGTSADGGYDASAVGDPLQTYIRCIIANVIMFQLIRANCGRNQGIRQALYILQNLMTSVHSGVNVKTCTWVVSNELKVGGKVIGAQFDEWIMGNEKMQAKMNKLQQRVKCKRTGRQTSDHWKRRMELLKEGKLREAMETEMTRILKKVGKKVEPIWGPVPSDDDDEDEDEDAQEEDTNGSAKPVAKPPVVNESPKDADPAKTEDQHAGKKSTCTKNVTESHGGQSGRGQYADPIDDHRGGTGGSSVSFTVAVTTPECSDPGTAVTVPEPPPKPEPEPEPEPEAPAPSNAGATGPSSETTTASPEAATPSTPTDTPSKGTPGHGKTSDKKDGAPDGDGGNDDPPPLNPPPPKPNPNPDQSGSSGSFSDADLADGVSGGEGKAGGDGAGSSGTGSTGPPNAGSSGPTSAGTGATGTHGAGSPPSGGQTPETKDQPLPILPTSPKTFDPKDLIPYTPAIIPAVVGIGLIAFFLWKYFAYLGQTRRRTYRTVRDVPSPPLAEEILDHLQRGDLPPPDYGYTTIRDRRPASAAERRGQRSPRVHKRTIIELHLEVLNECEAAEWENVKDDYLQIVVQEFEQELMRDGNGYSSFPDAPSTHQGLSGTNVASTVDPPTDSDGTDACSPHDPDPWRCMETIELATDPCPPNDPDPWRCMETIQLPTDPCRPHEPDPWSCMENIQLATNPCRPNEEDRWSCMESMPLATDPCPPNEQDRWHCMETIQFDAEQSRAHSDHGDATSYCTHWINWIDRHQHMLRACTTQPWFLQLKADWKQYQRAHMAANEDNGVCGHSEFGDAATMERKKLDAWKEWVAQQHGHMRMYNAQEWFQRLLNNVAEETVPAKAEVPGVDTHFKMEQVMAAEDLLQVRAVPRSQPLHPQLYMKKPLTAQTWILLLALVIEQCDVDCRLKEKELYVDALLHKL